MKELLENIAKSLVNHPEDVEVTVSGTEQSVVLELKVNETDMGKEIGRQGRIAKAIRSVMKAAAVRENKKVTVEIMYQKITGF